MNILLKSVENHSYSVQLREIENKYYVVVETRLGITYGKPLRDYNVASSVFEYVVENEGRVYASRTH